MAYWSPGRRGDKRENTLGEWALLYCYFYLFLFPGLNFITILILASGHSHGSWLILLLGMLGSFSAFAFLFTLFSKFPCIDSKLTGRARRSRWQQEHWKGRMGGAEANRENCIQCPLSICGSQLFSKSFGETEDQ